MRYRYNPYCSCGRCRAHGFMGPAVLITLGVLFLLDQLGHTRLDGFRQHLAGVVDRDRTGDVPAT